MFDEEKEEPEVIENLIDDKPEKEIKKKGKKSKKEKEIVIEVEKEGEEKEIKLPELEDLKLPCDNRECKHTFKSIAHKKYAEKAGCPVCGT